MNNKIITLISGLFFLLQNGLMGQPCREVIGYYPGWQWYDRNKLVKPASIDYSKYSIINYAFFQPNANGTISGTDSWADENILLGQNDWVQGGYIPNTSLVDLAHNAGVKVLISVGGWTLSNYFPAIAANAAKRATFAHACVNLVSTYNLDGIDLDWEYPGYAPNGGTPQDATNFTVFLAQIRDSLTNYGIQHNKTMLLTSCFGASATNMANIQWNNVLPLIDAVNVMTYDFFGSWDNFTCHNAPLYATIQGDTSFNDSSTILRLLNQYGVPPGKINMGIPFYGRSNKTSSLPALYANALMQVDNSTFWEDDGAPLYYNIMLKQNLFTYHWDASCAVPYLSGNGSLHTFVSFDNEQSIALKAQFIVNHNLRGAIIWEITGDYIETAAGSGLIAGTPLVDTLNSVFCGLTTHNETITNQDEGISFSVDGQRLELLDASPTVSKEVFIYNLTGTCVYNGKFSTHLSISLPCAGMYFLQCKGIKELLNCKVLVLK